MQKNFFFTFLLFLSVNSFAQELTITQKFPESAVPGGDYIVEITVIRTEVLGFMKFFQAVPSGCIAKEIESKGGSFSFNEGGAKIVWIDPPAENDFTISYQVIIPKGVEGVKNINGKFSYLLNSERKAYDLETKTISIGDVLVGKSETVLVTRSDRTIVTTSPILNPKEPDMAPSRILPDSIPKEKDLPLVVEPKKEEEKTVSPPVETPVSEQPVTPAPVAVKEEKEIPAPIIPEPVKEEIKVETPVPVKKEEEVLPTEPIKKEEEKPVLVTNKPIDNLPAKANVPVTAIPSTAVAGKTFRVQIGAFNLKPKIVGVSDLSSVVLDNGMTKYFSGNFSTYEQAAKQKKELIEKGFKGAFIVSFENGKIVK